MFSEREINSFGYKLVAESKLKDALAIFKIQVMAFPDRANPYDSLGETYLSLGDKEKALKNYEKALELNPSSANAKKMIEKIKNNN